MNASEWSGLFDEAWALFIKSLSEVRFLPPEWNSLFEKAWAMLMEEPADVQILALLGALAFLGIFLQLVRPGYRGRAFVSRSRLPAPPRPPRGAIRINPKRRVERARPFQATRPTIRGWRERNA